jgi:hypothetical protein
MVYYREQRSLAVTNMEILTVDQVATRFWCHILQDFHLHLFVAPSKLGSAAVKVSKKLPKMLRKNTSTKESIAPEAVQNISN